MRIDDIIEEYKEDIDICIKSKCYSIEAISFLVGLELDYGVNVKLLSHLTKYTYWKNKLPKIKDKHDAIIELKKHKDIIWNLVREG